MTSNGIDFSRSGDVNVAGAKITDAELDTIEAEVKNSDGKTDVPSILISVLSAVAVIINTLKTDNWAEDKASLCVFMIAVGTVFIQAYRAIAALTKKPSQHQKNAERYIGHLRGNMRLSPQVIPPAAPTESVQSP